MQTIYVKFDYPEEHYDLQTISEELLNRCFRIGQYPNAAMALSAYANTRCDWSVLLDDSQDYHTFVEEAKVHIRKNDIDWLEQHFT